MTDSIKQHLWRLRLVCGGILASCAIYGLIVVLLPAPETPPLSQADHLLWIFALIGVVNVVTLMPVYRAMLATPRHVYAVSQDLSPLLSAHFAAHVVAYARLEALAVLGLALFFIAGRVEWFWAFNAIAAAGMVLLWPRTEKVQAITQTPEGRPVG